MNEKIIMVLLIATIVLSILSVVLMASFSVSDLVFTRTVVKENDISSANIGLVIQETSANKNG